MDTLHRTRFETESSSGNLVHELQAAYASEKWLARIVTLPDRVWREPVDRSLLTFHAGTREEVEGVAFAHILKECELRGERILGLNYAACVGLAGKPARRIVAMVPVSYQVRTGGPVSRARRAEKTFTANLSETGLFIVTCSDIETGSLLSLHVGLPGLREILEGQVAWARLAAEEGRPRGAGVQLVDPPLTYRAGIQNYR